MAVIAPLPRARRNARKCPIVAHRLIRETPACGTYARIPIREARDVYSVIALDAQHKILPHGIITITRGILNSSLVHAREVFRAAIAANAYAIILCHNHPSGDPTPSPEDRLATSQLVSAGRLIGIEVLDHIVAGAGRYTSFAESGIL